MKTETGQETTTAELLPCPFCGQKTNLTLREKSAAVYPFQHLSYVHCAMCGGMMTTGFDAAEAKKRWNTRVVTPVPKLNIRCDFSDGLVRGSRYLTVVGVEVEDDGSLTAVTDHWSMTSTPATKEGTPS